MFVLWYCTYAVDVKMSFQYIWKIFIFYRSNSGKVKRMWYAITWQIFYLLHKNLCPNKQLIQIQMSNCSCYFYCINYWLTIFWWKFIQVINYDMFDFIMLPSPFKRCTQITNCFFCWSGDTSTSCLIVVFFVMNVIVCVTVNEYNRSSSSGNYCVC